MKNNIFHYTKKSLSLLITVQLAFFFISDINAQSEYLLSEDDVFEIPDNNFSFHFSSNGTFESAGLINGFWVFEKLELFNSRNDNKLFLKVSGQDCSIIIESYYVYNRTFEGENMKRAVFRYTTSVFGTQTFNLGLDPKMGSFDARLNREWVGLNHGWTVSSNGTYSITKATENVSLLYYGYPESFANNQDFFGNHYVLIYSSIIFSITLIFAVLVKKKFNKNSKPFKNCFSIFTLKIIVLKGRLEPRTSGDITRFFPANSPLFK